MKKEHPTVSIPIRRATKHDNRMVIRLWVCSVRCVEASALIDTGADSIYISPSLARRCGAAMKSRGRPITIGKKTKRIARRVGVVLRTRTTKAAAVAWVISPWSNKRTENKTDIVLGMEWLRSFHAMIDTKRRILIIEKRTDVRVLR